MKKLSRPLLYLLLVLAACMLLSVGVGSIFIPPGQILSVIGAAITGQVLEGDAEKYRVILLSLRLPRTLLMALTGAALAGSGAAYQGLFRNPLADPYLIGAASGAGLGAVIALSLNLATNPLGFMAIPMAAFLTALITVWLVYQIARTGKTIPVTNLILAGVAVSSFATALTSFLMINASGELRRAVIWLLGGSTLAGWKPLVAQLPYTILGLGILLAMSYRLNVLQFGDEQAGQLGINVPRSRGWIVFAATLATSAAVAFTGIIGFVGLVVPHIFRNWIGGDARQLLPLSLIGGAIFLLAADILSRVLMAPQELPVGIITALCGAPFFLLILRKARKEMW
jgi:iron complex transport system permease protein